NVEVGVAGMSTLPMVTSSVSATPEHESGTPPDSIIGLNVRTIGASERFVIFSDSFHHSSTHASEAEELYSETMHQVFVPQWNVLNDSLLDDYDVSREFVDHLALPAFFSHICKMDYHHLFIKFNVGTARQACLNAEVRMRTEYCLSERKRLESECEKQADCWELYLS
nr:hypothetical protein [Tanacetum cinerariifolium]